MAAKTYSLINGSAPGAAATPKQPTGATIRTMLQLAANATTPAFRLIEYWAECDAFAAAAPGQVELLRLDSTTPATMSTAFATADILKANDPNAANCGLQLSTTTSAFATAAVTEGTMVNPFNIRQDLLAPTAGIYFQWPLGREPEVPPGKYVRGRVTFGSTVNMVIGVTFEE